MNAVGAVYHAQLMQEHMEVSVRNCVCWFITALVHLGVELRLPPICPPVLLPSVHALCSNLAGSIPRHS